MADQNLPLVSCVMPTYNRRQFMPYAISYFLRQDYENKELIIIDDGTDSIQDLVPDNSSIRYYRIKKKITLGSKRNFGAKESRGEIIAHWDDDDWYSHNRLGIQVETLLRENTNVCGINSLLYFDLIIKVAYQYIYPTGQRIWLAGSSMCYKKSLWDRNKFDEINVGEDGLFIWRVPSAEITVLCDSTIAIHTIHTHNTSPKKTSGVYWHYYPVEKIRELSCGDWQSYFNCLFS